MYAAQSYSMMPPPPPRPLLAPPPPPPAPVAPPPPMGGNTWRPTFLYGQQPAPTYAYAASPTGGALGSARPIQNNHLNPAALRQELVATLNEGTASDLVGPIQVRKLDQVLAQMQPGQLESLKTLINAATTRVEQIFILKAFAANEPWANLVQFAGEMRGRSEEEIIRRCTMRDGTDIVQQWQDACGPTMIQAAAGEVDPRFAWELNKTWDINAIDPLGQNSAVAEQQKQWLEAFGGRAVQRGQSGGAGIAIGEMLNRMLAPITGAQYTTQPAENKSAALNQVANSLAQGFDVPLRISWDRPGGADSGHFVLALSVRNGGYGREFQIHDPWTGKTAWVAEQNLLGETLPPMFPNYARLTHFYQPTMVA